MIESALPVEGAPLAVKGPYDVTSEPTSGTAGLVAYRPTDLAKFPRADKLPVVVWGNGGCAIDGTRYAGFLSTIASHGFLVISTARQGDAPPQGGTPPRQATADDMRAAIDWATKEKCTCRCRARPARSTHSTSPSWVSRAVAPSR